MNLHLVGTQFLMMTQHGVYLREQMAEVKSRQRSVEEEPGVSREISMQVWELHGRMLGCKV